MQAIKFSIIVPVYNVHYQDGKNMLKMCLESLVNQSYKNIEIILIDDGSTDEAPAICDQYASSDHRIVVIHKKNEGAGKARNVGIKNATGDYLFFVDADDTIETRSCEAFYDMLVKFPDVEIITAGYTIFSGKKISKFCYTPASTQKVVDGFEFLSIQLQTGLLVTGVSAQAVKVSFLSEHNLLFRADLVGGEDTEWTFKLFYLAQKIYISDYIHYHYYLGHVSRSNPKNHFHRATGIIKYCIDLADFIKDTQDQKLKSKLLTTLVSYSLHAIYKGKLIKPSHKDVVDIDFLRRNAYTKQTKRWVQFYSMHPMLFWILWDIRHHKLAWIKRMPIF
jgi:glycosyltransferase involved in cell wall biosynthesis